MTPPPDPFSQMAAQTAYTDRSFIFPPFTPLAIHFLPLWSATPLYQSSSFSRRDEMPEKVVLLAFPIELNLASLSVNLGRLPPFFAAQRLAR